MEQKRNPRKFRVWDSKTIIDSLQICLQLQAKIDEVIGANTLPDELPDSVLPTDVLYDIAASYAAMYEKLMIEGLIQSSNNPKLNRKLH
jgi:hypothetical protein